jgi:acyl carrier protein
MAEDDHLLVVNLHHIIADGRSVEMLFEELAAAYGARRKGGPAALPALSMQYADYAAFERNWLATPAIDAKIAWWKTQLAGAPPLLPLPADHPRPRVQSSDGEVEMLVFGPELTARLRKVAADRRASLFMIVMTGFAALLARYSGESDLCIASPVENRGIPGTERLLGAFVNTIILRVNCEGDPAFETLLNRVRATALDAYDHHDAPFQRVVDALQPDRRIAASPLAQVSISWLGGHGDFLTLPGLAAEPIAFDYNRVKLDLELEVHETASELHVAWVYSSALFTRASMQWMVADFVSLLESATAAPATPLSRLDVRPESARGSLLQVRSTSVVAGPATDGPPVAARNDLEREIGEVWSSVLGVTGISVNADLFSIGGHSLMAIRIAAQLAARFDVDLRPSAVFNAPTIALLAETVAALQAARLEAILAEVESLSDDEAKANLTT